MLFYSIEARSASILFQYSIYENYKIIIITYDAQILKTMSCCKFRIYWVSIQNLQHDNLSCCKFWIFTLNKTSNILPSPTPSKADKFKFVASLLNLKSYLLYKFLSISSRLLVPKLVVLVLHRKKPCSFSIAGDCF